MGIGETIFWYAVGGIVVLAIACSIINSIYEWYQRDVNKKCPACGESGVFEQVSDVLKNKRRTSRRILRMEGADRYYENEYTTTEYWESTYRCSACGHEAVYEHTDSYRS